jgi:hypothetical protein
MNRQKGVAPGTPVASMANPVPSRAMQPNATQIWKKAQHSQAWLPRRVKPSRKLALFGFNI